MTKSTRFGLLCGLALAVVFGLASEDPVRAVLSALLGVLMVTAFRTWRDE